jgi:hypothetical protein
VAARVVVVEVLFVGVLGEARGGEIVDCADSRDDGGVAGAASYLGEADAVIVEGDCVERKGCACSRGCVDGCFVVVCLEVAIMRKVQVGFGDASGLRIVQGL